MILFRVQLRIPAAVRDRVVNSLLRLVGPTRAVKGCIACGTYVDVEDENTLVYVEEWETQAAIDERLRAEDLRVLLSVLDLSSEPPVVRFEAIGETRGMEVIAAARAGVGR
ncbi:MAG TPA: antibiotic biosynthesis monooxygenase [Phycisphaerae bacterium]|nr:antibiotic biosynthesis monooxygenase [Phycisphaerae bacterium]HRY70095.1 antibiotic biosynthesis monooxygenase [Phycisphaerae bacterium]HSA27371.1 antibiotic biosynthesis monooxygenase [Phycisphaerae bacterium]